jgi:putative membrane protein
MSNAPRDDRDDRTDRGDGGAAGGSKEADGIERDHGAVGTYLRGVAMGSADAVPGVSGGTIALITGIYDRLIAAVTAASPSLARRALGGLVGDRGELRRVWCAVDGAFLLALGAGIATAILTVTRVLHVALETVPVLTYGFFFGLIGASAVVLRDEFRVDTRGRVAAAVAGAGLAFGASGSASAALGESAPATFFAGAVAVSAMILPGISGSLLLVILGQYDRMTEALSVFVDSLLAVATGGPTAAVVETGVPVVAFLAGGVVGLLTIAHAVRAALSARREATLAFLIGLIVGALRAPVARVGEEVGAWTAAVGGEFVVAAAVGALLVVGIDRLAGGVDLE